MIERIKLEFSWYELCIIACRINRCHCAINYVLEKEEKATQEQIINYALSVPDAHHCFNPCDHEFKVTKKFGCCCKSIMKKIESHCFRFDKD